MNGAFVINRTAPSGQAGCDRLNVNEGGLLKLDD
jgi:hypothetical protein